MRFTEIASLFVKIGASAFGGWATTAVLLERALVIERKQLAPGQLKGAAAYAQMLPGATQVLLVTQAGYLLRGFGGAVTAVLAYLLPAVALMTLFAFVYFAWLHDRGNLAAHLDGLTAALAGVMAANAYKVGAKHATHWRLWVVVGAAAMAVLWLAVHPLVVLLVPALAIMALSFRKSAG